ncbi:hypothetical protein [Leifsonia shinshuensis]|uniref:hypothetical protein n=1 Tax=Leifsonia TaxID=110932 RepID=UPI002863ED83|nr:hypothetical protein [Leifsonia shinshuensis]MDR6970002.1 putative transcriptional regulator [Leifsonia shinshuensis]
MPDTMTPGRSKKLIAFRDDQIAALSEIAADTHTNFTATVLDAVDAYIAAHDHTTQEIVDRLMRQNAGLLDRLRDA